MGLTLIYNRGKGESEHLNKNIKMFESFGIKCESFRSVPPKKIFSNADILYLNWYENIYNGFLPIALGQFIVKNIVLSIAKAKKIRIYASQHNKVQHDSKHPKLSRMMFKRIYEMSDKIIVFSEGAVTDLEQYISPENAQKKAYFIPPVNYIGSYPYQEHEWITKLDDDSDMIVMFVGSLNHPYKNVDMVIDLAKEMGDKKIKFVFAGKMANQQQADFYREKISGQNNIVGEFRFIKDEEMAQLLEISDVVIMPYDIESISNSGTARLAFSYGRTVICPRIPSLETIPTELIYTYSYIDRVDHKNKVKKEILDAYKDYQSEKELLHDKGYELKKIMEKYNSPEVVTKKYRDLFGLN
jgi:hypothetical protein